MEIKENINLSFISAIKPQVLFLGLKNLTCDSNETSKLFCKICLKTPIIEFQNLFKLKLICNCSNIKIYTISEVNENFIIDLENTFDRTIKAYEFEFTCDIHKKIFQFFCNNCNNDLCEECIKNHECYNKKNLIDFNSILIILFILIQKINKIRKRFRRRNK